MRSLQLTHKAKHTERTSRTYVCEDARPRPHMAEMIRHTAEWLQSMVWCAFMFGFMPKHRVVVGPYCWYRALAQAFGLSLGCCTYMYTLC
jgi:hypothetical protein